MFFLDITPKEALLEKTLKQKILIFFFFLFSILIFLTKKNERKGI